MKRQKSRIYWRTQRGGVPRAYADLRKFGGGREALIAEGETYATDSPEIAEQLLAARLVELAAERTLVAAHQKTKSDFETFCAFHLVEKKRSGKFPDELIERSEQRLADAVAFFGPRELRSIKVRDVREWAAKLATDDTYRHNTKTPKRRSPATVRKYLNTLSNVFRRAQGEELVDPGYNPVRAMMDKPVAEQVDAEWLEVDDAALLLEVARTYKFDRPNVATRVIYPLLATFLMTGGRAAEVMGLEWDDVSFDRKTVRFRKNRWRGIKTKNARVMPLWPQLAAILREHEDIGNRTPSRLIFPSFGAHLVKGADGKRVRVYGEHMIGDFRKTLDAIAERAGWEKGEIRSKMFRHTYCAARLQTLDRGAPIAKYTVERELGHGSGAMITKTYAHLGDVRHRSEVVEFRVDQHAGLRERLEALKH